MNQDELIKMLAETAQRSKTNANRLEALEHSSEALHKMATALEVLATKQNGIAEQVDRINAKVTAIEERPLRRLYTLIGYALAALCSAAVGAMFGNLL